VEVIVTVALFEYIPDLLSVKDTGAETNDVVVASHFGEETGVAVIVQ
jgi:hypothetical protein